jgi:parvulin-like peptidyl-prolyl isomerase
MLALHRREVLAALMSQEITRESAVTPEEISSFFAEHHAEFDQAQIYQVVIRKKQEGAKEGTPGLTAEEAKTRAEEIRKALSSGEDPKKVAEKYQVPNVVRVDANPQTVHRGEMRQDMEKAAFELKDGQVSEVFDLGPSLAFIKVGPRKVVELKEVSTKIQNMLQQQKMNSTYEELKKKANVWMDDAFFAPPKGTSVVVPIRPRASQEATPPK